MTRSLSSILLTAVLLLVLPAAARAAPSATGDFDGDGYGDLAGDFDGNGRADLAVGIPDDTVDGQEGAGAVTVLYSTTGGVSAGDLDGDGEDDLAIGIPGGRIGGDIGAGAVAVPGAVTHVIRRTYD
jgi:hypothetical protein